MPRSKICSKLQVNFRSYGSFPVLNSELDDLENLEVILRIVQGFGDELPPACQSTCGEVWAIFDPFLAKYGDHYDIAERSNQVLRHGLKLFGPHVHPIIVPVLTRLSSLFESTGLSSYIWMSSKVVGYFGNEEDVRIRAVFRDVYDRSTRKVAALLAEKTPRDIPDGKLPTLLDHRIHSDTSYSHRRLLAFVACFS